MIGKLVIFFFKFVKNVFGDVIWYFCVLFNLLNFVINFGKFFLIGVWFKLFGK